MTNWDDYRIFLAAARAGTVTGAAKRLGVNHSTVSRRITAMEETAGVQQFDKHKDGYSLTDAGLALLQTAGAAETAMLAAEQTLRAHDHSLSGELVVTAPAALGVIVLTPIIARFRHAHPDILVNLVSSDAVANLSRGEADIAIRASNGPDEHLVGRRLCVQKTAIYAHREYWREHSASPSIVVSSPPSSIPAWSRQCYPEATLACCTSGKLEMLAAIEAGIGIGRLPCRLGDARPLLLRVPPLVLENDLDIWLLMQADMQHTPRIRAFADFVYDAFRKEAALFEGTRTDVAPRLSA